MTSTNTINTIETEIKNYLNSIVDDMIKDFYSRMYTKYVESKLRANRGSIIYKVDFFDKNDKRKYDLVKDIIKEMCYQVNLEDELPKYIYQELNNYSYTSYIGLIEDIPLDENSLAYGLYEIYKKYNINIIPNHIIDEFIQNIKVSHQDFYEYSLENMICMYMVSSLEEKIDCLIEDLREDYV